MADSKKPDRHASETKRLETCPVFARTKSQGIGQNCCRRASHSEWPRGLCAVRRRTIARHRGSKKGNSESAKCSGAGKAVRCRRFRCRRRMERITRAVPLRKQRNDYLASRYKDEKTRFPAA